MTSIASSNDPSASGASGGQERSGPRLLLTLNCVEERVQLVLARDGSLVLHQEWAAPARVMRYLAPALEQALDLLGLRISDLSGIACVRGPGNFTGLRLCLATTYGLALGGGVPMAGLDYLPLLAAGPASLLQGRLAVLTHARSGLVHAQVFEVPTCNALSTPRILNVKDPADLRSLADLDGALFLLGSGVRRNLEQLRAGLSRARILDAAWDHPQSHVLIHAAQNAAFAHAPIVPFYLRACDAEENLEVFAAKRGFTSREAREQLRIGMEGEQ